MLKDTVPPKKSSRSTLTFVDTLELGFSPEEIDPSNGQTWQPTDSSYPADGPDELLDSGETVSLDPLS